MDKNGNVVKAIFLAALEREPGAERTAYLDTACRDNAALRQRVEELLAAHERAGEVLDPARGSDNNSTDLASGIHDEATVDLVPVADESTIAHVVVPRAEPASASEPLGNVRYFGDYELLREIARGGMGVVYRGV